MPGKKPSKKEFHCIRCGHEWDSRGGRRPLKCPSCKSLYWETEDGMQKRRTPKARRPAV